MELDSDAASRRRDQAQAATDQFSALAHAQQTAEPGDTQAAGPLRQRKALTVVLYPQDKASSSKLSGNVDVARLGVAGHVAERL
jgi:hypothetical protein